MTVEYTPQELGIWIEDNLMGCKFVGVASDGEIFLKFENNDNNLQSSQIKYLREQFPKISKITTVLEPSITQVKKMVDELNTVLEKEEKDPNLLHIKGIE